MMFPLHLLRLALLSNAAYASSVYFTHGFPLDAVPSTTSATVWMEVLCFMCLQELSEHLTYKSSPTRMTYVPLEECTLGSSWLLGQ